MAKIRFENGQTVNFEGNPTPEDVDFVAKQIGITPSTQSIPKAPVKEESVVGAGLKAGLNAIKNTPKSMFNFAKGVLSSINPINTVKNIADIAKGGAPVSEVIKGLPKAAIETVVPSGIRSLATGDLETASKAFQEDPFGQAAPAVLGLAGGARAINKKAVSEYAKNPYSTKTIPKNVVDTAISKVGSAVTKPITKVAKGVSNLTSKTTKSATSQVTGFEPDTISKIVSDPKEFSRFKQEQATRGNIADEFGRKIDEIDQSLTETGKGYQPVRLSKEVIKVPARFIDSVLDTFGLKTKGGKITADTTSATRNISDIKAIQKFKDDWGSKKTLTPNEFLNMRSDLAELAKYDKLTGTGKTAKSQTIAMKIRELANEKMRPSVKGLKELDEAFSTQKTQFDQIRKDFLQKDPETGGYTFKDGAINKIASATNKGKGKLLERMEEVMPGITQKLELLKAVEDIQKAYGIKVGTYGRSIMAGGALLGNIPSIILSIMSYPTIAVPLLRSLGYTKQMVAPVVDALKTIAGDVNKFSLPPVLGVQGIKGSSTETKNYPVTNGLKSELKGKPTESKPY